MDIRGILARDHSVETAEEAAGYAETDYRQFLELINVLSGNDKELARRAAWAFGKAGEKRPEWVELHVEGLLVLLADSAHPAIHRNIYRVLQFTEIPVDHYATLFDLALKELHDPNRPAAIKVFAMTVAANISATQPELKTELKLSIQENIPYGSAGFRNRASKILRTL